MKTGSEIGDGVSLQGGRAAQHAGSSSPAMAAGGGSCRVSCGEPQSGMSTPRRRDIFTQYPANTYEELIVRYSGEDDGRLGASFAQAADRLAGTHTGRPVDDALLLPYLYLYRHAMELDVKHAIRFAAKLRTVKGERDPALSDPALGERLKKTLRHKLPALVTELEKHLELWV